MKSIERHNQDVNAIIALLKNYLNSKNSEKLIFTHVGSHSTRERLRHTYNNLDISNLNKIISINLKKKEVLTEPSIPMNNLVNETLKVGLLPKIVMEFPGITVGGAIEGAALESSSFKYGQFNDCCIEYEIVIPPGKRIIASRKKNPDLFYGKTGSYGSIGLLTSVKLELVKAHKFVLIKYLQVNSPEEAIDMIQNLSKEEYDYLEGIIFDKNKAVVITGELTDSGNAPIQEFSKSSDPWFYKHVEKITQKNSVHEELIPIIDYLFRWDRGAYWTGKYFLSYFGGYNWLTKKFFDSSLHAEQMYEALHLGNLSQLFFIQDFYIPIEKASEFINWTINSIEIFPLWICPMKPTKMPEKLSPHYNNKTKLILNVGIYGRSIKFAKNYLKSNREAEKKLYELNGRKMLYAHQYYPKKEFWRIYDKDWYDNLRKKYHADKILSDVYEKTHVKENYDAHPIRGAIKFYMNKLFKIKKEKN